jgi:hypothetical protein
VRAFGLSMAVTGWTSPRHIRLAAPLLALAACAFDPVARPVKPEQLSEGPTRVLRTLDPYGVHALIRYTNPDGSSQAAVTDWRAGKRCELPKDTLRAWNPLSGDAASARAVPDRSFLMPFARGESDDALALWLIDQDCTQTGPLAPIRHETVSTIVSAKDQRNIFLFRDADATLYVVDPTLDLEAHVIAEQVSAVVPASDTGASTTDVLWLIEAGQLTQRGIDGSLAVQLGRDVSQFAVYRGTTSRVAYVDGDDLYEAFAPSYRPALRAEGACNPSYNGQYLDLHYPCDTRQLVRVDLVTGALDEFEDGVYESATIDGLQFDYANVPKADGSDGVEPALFLQLPYKVDGEVVRQRVSPILQRGSLTVLGNDPLTGRVAGQTNDGTFGIWSLGAKEFAELFPNVRVLVPLRDERNNQYLWLMHYKVVDSLGTLAVFTEEDLTLKQVATGVPPFGNRGYIVDLGAALPRFPYPEAIVLYLEQSVELAFSTPENRQFKGRLRAQLLSGALAADIDSDVSSFVLVASPLPGVLYGIEEGPKAGLWFAAL